MEQKFYYGKDLPIKELGKGISRQIMAYGKQVMMVKIDFEAGVEGAIHSHPHVQATYVISGRFRFVNDGETREVAAGDSLYFAPNAAHGSTCLEKGTLIDVFSPYREDFV